MSEVVCNDWFTLPLGQLSELRRGITYSSLMLESAEGGLPYVNMKSFLKGGGFNPDGTKSYAGTYVPNDLVGEHDLLIANTDVTSGDIAGVPALLPDDLSHEKVLYSHHVTRIRITGDIEVPFLYYLLCLPEYRSHMLRIARGTTVLMLDMHAIKRIPVSAPKIEAVRRRIVEILSTLDETIEQTESLIAKHQKIKSGLMHDLFTRGVKPDGHLRPTREQAPELYKESPLGWIPKEWVVKPVSEIFEIQLGKMLSKLAKTGKWTAPYLGNRAVQWDFVDCKAIEEMDFTPSERQKFSLIPGDLLVCEGGDVGRTAMWQGEMEECYYQKAIHRLRPKSSNSLPSYMLRFMRFARENGYFREFTSQSSIAHLTQEKLGAVPMILPNPEEQDRIAKRFDNYDALIQSELSLLSNLRQQKHGLMHDLLTGRVRVRDKGSRGTS